MNPLRNVVLLTALSALPFAAFPATPTCLSTDAQCIANVPINSIQTSKVTTVTTGLLSGLVPAKISVNLGSYRINSGAFTSATGSIRNKDNLTARLTAAATPGTEVKQVIKIAGLPDQVFRVITAASPISTTPATPSPPSPTPGFIRWSSYGKLTLPIDADGRVGADEIPASALDTYSSIYFYNTSAGLKTSSGYTAANGETVFWAPVNGGGLTENAKFVRSEMREQWSSSVMNWSAAGTHIQTGRLKVTQLPTPKSAGMYGRTVFAQIHCGEANPPVKLLFTNGSKGPVVYGVYNLKPTVSEGEVSSIKIPVALGQSFTYELKMVNGIVTTKINDQIIDTRDLNKEWKGRSFYFKAGNYVQNGTDTASGSAEVVYSALNFSHN